MPRNIRFLTLFLVLVVGTVVSTTFVSAQQVQPNTAQGITEISLQRTQCFGSCPVDELVLSKDGTAHYSGQMHTARLGQYEGDLNKSAFEQLAQWLVKEGFFTLEDSYGDKNGDSPDQIISAVQNGQRKTVVVHGSGSAPLALWGVQKIIQGAAADIYWRTEPSGIRDTVTWRKISPALPKQPEFQALSKEVVLFRLINSKQFVWLRTDENGKYEIALRPGTYSIEFPTIERNSTMGGQQRVVEVQPDKFTELTSQIEIQPK